MHHVIFAYSKLKYPQIPELSIDENHEHGDEDTESEHESDMGTPREPTPRITTLSDEEESERHDAAPMPIPARPNARKRFSTYQHTPMDVDRGRSTRKLRNVQPSLRNTL